MKYSTDPIFEAYSNHRKQFILEQSVASFYASDPLQELRDLYQYDLDCIEELMTEGMLGDAFGKVKGGIQKATSYVANKGLQLLFSLIKKTATPEELKEIQGLKDADLEELAKKGKEALKSSSSSEDSATKNESVYLNKSFFASILTESNIEVMLEKYGFITEQILSEARAGYSPKFAANYPEKMEKRSLPYKQGIKRQRAETAKKNLELAKLAKVVADGLKKKYNTREVNRFLLALDNEVSQRAPVTGLRRRPTDIAGGDESSLTTSGSRFRSPAPKRLAGSEEPTTIDVQAETLPIEPEALPYSGETAPKEKKKEGLIRKAINWVKANPKRTAGTLVGIIAAIGVAVGGPAVLLPMLAKAGLGSTALGAAGGAISGAGLGAAKNIASQGFSNKKFSGKELGKAALKGGAFGAVTGAIGGATKLADQDVATGAGDSGAGEVDTADVGDAKEGGSDYTGGAEDVSATSEDFQKYNGEELDPKSWRDKIKMAALDKLKKDGDGQIDGSKYNSFVKKLVAMGKDAKGKSIESIMGESYTVQYLSLLR
jgi:hypothetical protein